MGYRDDRDALREHAEMLEQELGAARAEIERLRRRPEPELPPLRPSGGGALAATSVLLLLFGLEAPVPRVVRLIAIAIGLLLLASVALLSQLLVLARTNELVVLSGGGGSRGFRKLRASRVLRRPLVEQASWLDLGLFRVSFSVEQTKTKDHATVDIHLIAHCRVTPAEPAIDRAISQLLGTPPEARDELVTTTLDPVVRNVVAASDRSDLTRDRTKLAAAIRHAAEAELELLGLTAHAVWVLEVEPIGALD